MPEKQLLGLALKSWYCLPINLRLSQRIQTIELFVHLLLSQKVKLKFVDHGFFLDNASGIISVLNFGLCTLTLCYR
jgi:hypothetical protein